MTKPRTGWIVNWFYDKGRAMPDYRVVKNPARLKGIDLLDSDHAANAELLFGLGEVDSARLFPSAIIAAFSGRRTVLSHLITALHSARRHNR